ncbi:hypothetical protein GCM10027589_07270 [Actinocorallia lasiicapitis]
MKSDEYRTLDRLRIRQKVHLVHSDPPDDVELSTLAVAPAFDGAKVLDVGTGTGSFPAMLNDRYSLGRLVGLDLSAAAVAATRAQGISAVQADVQRLPFTGKTFDLVYARHMLDHVPDVLTAVQECRRVLRDGGSLVAVLNRAGQASKLSGLLIECVTSHDIDLPAEDWVSADAETIMNPLFEVFKNVNIEDFHGSLTFTEAAPLIEFSVSLLHFYGVAIDHPRHGEVAESVAAKITRRFAVPGFVWRDRKGYSVAVSVRAD